MKSPEIAYVTAVRMQNDSVKVDVITGRPGGSRSNIPFTKLFTGGVITPKQGDPVQLYELDDGTLFATEPMGTHYVSDAAGTRTHVSLPDLAENEMCFRFDDSTEIRIQKNGSVYDVHISASGDIHVDCAGQVYLGDSTGTHAPVARQGDPVSVDTTSGSGQIDSGSSNVSSS